LKTIPRFLPLPRTFCAPAPRRGLLVALMFIASCFGRAQQPPLRVAVVGLEHGHVEGFLSSLPQHSDVQLVGIADSDPALFAKYQKRFSLAETLFYPSEANMIEKTHPQAVLVYTSIAEHRAAIEIAAQYGVSVMVEKPLTISLDDAVAIRRTARHYQIHVLVNYETTWYASNKAAFNEVGLGRFGGNSGESRIGEVRRVVIHDGHQGPKEIGVPPEFFNWLTDPAKNGAGALYDFGCYGADLMTWLMHGETPLTVTAVLNQDKPQIYPRVDDDATIILTYPHTQAVIMASWNWPFGRKDMEVYGASGYAITVGSDKLRVRHEHDAEEQLMTAAPLQGMEHDSLSYLIEVVTGSFMPYGDTVTGGNNRSVIKGTVPGDMSSLDTNVIVMQILDAARESARTGKSVQLTRIGDN
jgi:predicted dehydrogenase